MARPESASAGLRGLSWVVAGLAAALAPHVRFLPAWVTLLFVAAAVAAGMLGDPAIESGEAPSPEVWGLGRRITFTVLHVYSIRMGAVFILSTTAIGRRTRIIPRWLVAAGIAAGGGRAVGIAFHRGRDSTPPEGAILVTRHLEPQLAPVLDRLAGLVSETGSTLSHLAILAREHHVPTVVAAHDALHRFPPGCRLLVDGSSGELRQVDEQEVFS